MKSDDYTLILTDTCGTVLEMDPAGKVVLSNGAGAIVSGEDLPHVQDYSWYEHCGYARTTIKGAKVYMHRLIAGANADEICDHLNGNRLDNRRENLRLVDKYGNARNRTGKREYLGVFQMGSKWGARVIRRGATYFLGSYDSQELAAYAVDAARLSVDGELVRPNLPGYEPTDEDRKVVEAVINKSFVCNRCIPPRTVQKMIASKLSDKYWAIRLGVKQNHIKRLRAL